MENVKVFPVVVFSVLLCVLGVQSVDLKELPSCNFRAVYNFGDSNSDTGGGSAAFWPQGPPSGNTFFGRPAGRGCDGRLMIDFIAEHLGLPYLSAYLDSIGTSFRHGANFAMGGVTIRPQNESMSLNGVPPFSLDIQMVQFNQFKARTSYLYNQAKNSHRSNLPRPQDFSKALYMLDIGHNDISAGLRKKNDTDFHLSVPDMVEQLAKAVQNLYDQGARTFWIHNTGPMGCLPVYLRYHDIKPDELDKQGCRKAQNDYATEFNRKLKDRVIKLRKELPQAALTYVDMYAAKYKLIGNAKQQGFVDATEVCCGFHQDDIHVYCGQKAKINGTVIYTGSCEDPSKYISWDGVHYSEAANHWVANHIINGSFSDPPLPITHACHKLT
ncbi:GDSL esterase/lipase At5g14450-like [Durio zibethinus]|uniref:GDSL esterase/lipase At5g14450-like n=1 Tax=Durio zibethinus TaxID=66656 RepID=A0A6P5YHD8_DURZI|nr:GDSL esterase/lipase At5g14450-like [Durio zibethinus]